MTTPTPNEIALTMDNLNCSTEEAIETLNGCINPKERLAAMGLADERGGDIVRRAGWREECYGN